jgi:hypothetical protein
MSDNPPCPSEVDLQAAVKALDSGPLTRFLVEGDVDAGELAGLILRSTSLMVQRPGDPKAARKAEFLAQLVDAYAAHACEADQAAMRNARDQLQLAGLGYQRILSALAQSDYAAMAPADRVSSVLWRAAAQSSSLMRESINAVGKGSYMVAQGMSLPAPGGRWLSPDTLNDALVGIAGSTLQMEAISQRWLDGDVVILPVLTPVTEKSLEAAADNDRTALAWGNWRLFEETARFLQGPMKLEPVLDADGTAPVSEVVTAPEPPDHWTDWACQNRRNDQYDQNLLELSQMDNLKAEVRPLSSAPPLAPEAILDIGEACALGAMSEFLGYAVKDDAQVIDGLRIIEWVRAFAVLSAVAEEREARPMSGEHPRLPIFTEDELVAALVQGGIAAQAAVGFLREVTFRRSSSDLYDAPLVQLEDGRFMLFSPASIGSNIAGVLRSIFARKQVVFERKGDAFEALLLKRLKEFGAQHGFEAATYTTSIDTQKYQYDVLILWDGYLFVLECKNRSVSDGRPVQARHFARENLKHARQVTRLAIAMETHPEHVNAAFSRDVGRVTVVPVVLNNLTYAREGLHEGVYFHDAGALLRFFKSPAVSARVALPLGGGKTRIHEVSSVRIWADTKPSVRDLLEQLKNPVQLKILRHHTVTSQFRFPLDDRTTAVVTEYTRSPQDHYTLAEIGGTKRREVRESFAKARKKAQKQKRKFDRSTELNGLRSPWSSS